MPAGLDLAGAFGHADVALAGAARQRLIPARAQRSDSFRGSRLSIS